LQQYLHTNKLSTTTS